MKKKIYVLLTITIVLIAIVGYYFIFTNHSKTLESDNTTESTLKTTVQVTTHDIADDFRKSLDEDEYTKHTIVKGNYKLIYFVKDHLNKEEGVAGTSGKWIYAFLYDQGLSKKPSYLSLITTNGSSKKSETQSVFVKKAQPAYIIETDSKSLKKVHYTITLHAGHISASQYNQYKGQTHKEMSFKNNVTLTMTLKKE